MNERVSYHAGNETRNTQNAKIHPTVLNVKARAIELLEESLEDSFVILNQTKIS